MEKTGDLFVIHVIGLARTYSAGKVTNLGKSGQSSEVKSRDLVLMREVFT